MDNLIKAAIARAKAENRFVSDRELKAEEETLKQEQGDYTQERLNHFGKG